MIPVAGLLVGIIPSSTVTVRTRTAPTRDSFGRGVEGTTTEVVETLPVHPATSRRILERLPEKDRQRETLALYAGTGSALAPASGTTPAEVVYKGATYTVAHVGDYVDQGGLYLILAQRQ